MKTQSTTSNSDALMRFFKTTFIAGILPICLLLLSMQSSRAGSATWNLNPTSGDWNTAANWTPTTVPNGPNDTATFDISDTTMLSISAQTEVNSIVFNVGASAYAIKTPFLGLTISGVGINNMSGIMQNITNGVPFSNPDANLFFTNNATTGNLVTVNTIGGDCNGGPAHTTFFDTASAGSATFINNGNTTCSENNGAVTSFFDSSSAANGTFINYPNVGASGFGGTTYFYDTSTAGNAIVIGYSGDAPGRIFFYAASTGGTSRVEVWGPVGSVLAELNICSHNAPGVTIGSIEGEGQVSLGGNNLTVGSNNHSTIFSGSIQDSGYFCGTGGSLTKIGRGTLILTGTNTYTGGTTVEDGQLLVDNTTGSGLGSGSVQANAGRLGGNGTIAGSVTVGTGRGTGATLAPGERCDELGTITIQGSLTFNSDARYNCGLKTRQHTIVDTIVANGVTINGGQFVIAARGSRALPRGTVLTVINNTAATPIAGTFGNLADGSVFTIGNNTYQVSYEGNDGNDLTLTVQ